MIRDLLKNEIEKAVKKLFGKEEVGFSISATERPEHGDYSSNIAMALKDAGNPKETANKIKEELEASEVLTNVVSKIEIAGPGFLNFRLKDEVVWGEMAKSGEAPRNEKPKTIVVEYGQENIAKPMSVGHLRSNIIGQSLFNILKFLGNKVISDNHLGDWGTQFGKLIVAYKKWGSKEAVEKNPIDELFKLYVQFHNEAETDAALEDAGRLEFKKLEDGDVENTKLWEWFRAESIKEFKGMYERLGSKYDYMHGEAFYKDDVREVIRELLDKKIAKQNEDGSIIVEFPEDFSPSPLLIQKSDGATLYSTRDLAAIKFYKKEFKPDLVLQCVGLEQELYFKQFYNTAERAGWIKPGEFVHIKNGMVRLPEGKMSTRKGNVVRLEKLFDEAEERIAKILDEKQSEIKGEERKKLIKDLGVGAVIFADLGQGRESTIVFTWDKMLNFDGYAAPYLQYTHARARSILNKGEAEGYSVNLERVGPSAPGTATPRLGETERLLAFKLSLFLDVVKTASETYHPHIIAQYLFELAQVFNKFYHSAPVLNAEKEDDKKLRLALVFKTAEILKTGLGLLGIKAPEKM